MLREHTRRNLLHCTFLLPNHIRLAFKKMMEVQALGLYLSLMNCYEKKRDKTVDEFLDEENVEHQILS